MRSRLMQISGAISLALLVSAAGCYSFTGGGLDPKLKTVAVLPLENKTTTPGLERELTELLSTDVRRRLGLREAPETRADVVVTGTIERYDVDLLSAPSADPRSAAGNRRKLVVIVNVVMRNPATGRELFKKTAQSDGGYAEGAELDGRKEAFAKLVNDIIQGVQSQW
jgi:hypothetical protein